MDQLAGLEGILRANRLDTFLALQHDPDGPFAKLHDHPVQMHLEAIATRVEEGDRLWKAYMATRLTEEEKVLAADFEKKRAAWAGQLSAVVDAVQRGEYGYSLVQSLLAAGRTEFSGAMAALARLRAYQVEVARQEYETAKASYENMLLLFAALTLFGITGLAIAAAGHHLRMTPSIGIALFPRDGETASALLKNADAAMYHAKEQGRAGFQFFREEMNALSRWRMAIEGELRETLAAGGLALHYQPKVCARDDRICGFEALLRWPHPLRGSVSPADFIPVAEQSGLIDAIGHRVLDEACRQLAAWERMGIADVRVAVNLSSRQLAAADLAERVRTALDAHGGGRRGDGGAARLPVCARLPRLAGLSARQAGVGGELD